MTLEELINLKITNDMIITDGLNDYNVYKKRVDSTNIYPTIEYVFSSIDNNVVNTIRVNYYNLCIPTLFNPLKNNFLNSLSIKETKMKLSECEVGDVISINNNQYIFKGFDPDRYCYLIKPLESCCNYCLVKYKNLDVELVSRNSAKSLEQQIQEKEIELENLKTKLRESNVKKVLDNLDPNTIYKLVHDGFEEVGFVFKGIDNCSIYGINMKQIGTIPTKSISKIFPLKEATETYHKLQLLLKNS